MSTPNDQEGPRRGSLRVNPPVHNFDGKRMSSLRHSVLGTSSVVNHRRSYRQRGTVIHIHPLYNKGKVRQYAYDLIESKGFHLFLLIVILTNTALIGFQTVKGISYKAGWYLSLLNVIYLAIYMVEFVVKFVATRLKYFHDKWNLFDFFIMATSIFDFFWPMIMKDPLTVDTDILRVFRLLRGFRALRALRVLRTIKFLKNLQITVTAIVQSIPALSSIIMLISLVLYIFAIIGKGLYKDVDPNRFGNIGRASFTLFQLITLDDWFFMYTEVRERNPNYWHILIYLIAFIVLENFIFINLFIAVIVDNLERAHAAARTSSMQCSPSTESLDSKGAAIAMPLQDELLDECPPSGAVEYYYEGRKDAATKLIGKYTEILATAEYHLEKNTQHLTNLNKLLDLAKKSSH